jgi:hypothetical protein
VGDVVLVGRYSNELEAQAVAGALRDAGLHPVVLARDPLAQLFDPFRGARMVVPSAEREAARELLAAFAAGELEIRTEGAEGEAPRSGLPGFRTLGMAAVWGILLVSALAAPGWVFVPLLLAIAALALVRR